MMKMIYDRFEQVIMSRSISRVYFQTANGIRHSVQLIEYRREIYIFFGGYNFQGDLYITLLILYFCKISYRDRSNSMSIFLQVFNIY